MDQAIRDRFSDAILQEAMKLYSIAEGQISELDGFESFIYGYRSTEQEFILRIAHSFRRCVALIEGEVDWINYLASGGASVPQVVLSANGRLVEVIEDGQGGQFLTTAFLKAAGKSPWELDDSEGYVERYGQTLGRIHALTKGYEPPPGRGRRPQWDDPIMQDVERNLPPTEALAVARYQATFDAVCDLPKDPDCYGLIHYDAHEANLLVDDSGRITLFDFDDCAYSWFICDIAIVLFHATAAREAREAFTAGFLPRFLRGYSRENRLAAHWLEQLPHFLKLREIDLYAVIHRSLDVENLDDWWCKRFMDGRKERIEQEIPVIDFDFASLANHLC